MNDSSAKSTNSTDPAHSHKSAQSADSAGPSTQASSSGIPEPVDGVSLQFEYLESEHTADPAKIAIVHLNRPEKLNGLTLPMLRRLSSIARSLARDTELRGVIIAGNGRSFTAGLDFADVFTTPVRVVTGLIPDIHGTNLFQKAPWDWRRLPVPVIAVVHGHCFGGGVQIALGADFRFTTSTAQWSVLETKWGLIPDMSGMRTLTDAVRPDVAKWLTMSGEVLDGHRAVELGLATWLVESHEEGMEQAKQKLAQLAGRSPDQAKATKNLFRDVNRSPRHTFRRERIEQIRLLVMENTNRARKAAMKKVAPKFARRGSVNGRPR